MRSRLDTAETVVLISAGAEWRVVRARFADATPDITPYGEWISVTLRIAGVHHRVVFLHGGWGKVAAAASAEYAIATWSPELIVNLGTCGGFEGQVRPGETVLATRTVIYDITEQMGDPDAAIARFTTDLDLSALRDPLPLEVVRSVLVSGDRDLIDHEVPQLQTRYGAVAGDWESGAIAFVAARHGRPCLILRTVTDLVGASGGEAYDNIDLFRRRTEQFFPRLVESLPGWLAQMRA